MNWSFLFCFGRAVEGQVGEMDRSWGVGLVMMTVQCEHLFVLLFLQTSRALRLASGSYSSLKLTTVAAHCLNEANNPRTWIPVLW